jgi:hypothetical protein
LGFSFGLRPDGSPGDVNETIAKSMERHRSDSTYVGVQWELAVILDREGTPWNAVAATPYIAGSDLTRPEEIIGRLTSPRQLAEQQLAARLSSSIINVEDLISQLNKIIDDPLLYVDFRKTIELDNLSRPKTNRTWTEWRAFPIGNQPLHKLHARRINRFILEKIFVEELKLHAYLNTPTVANELFQEFQVAANPGTCIQKIGIFCHPLHLSWCAYNVAKNVESLGNNRATLFSHEFQEAASRIRKDFDRLSADGVNPVPSERLGLAKAASPLLWGPSSYGEALDPDNSRWWDSQSSQEWTRNRRDYTEYNAS